MVGHEAECGDLISEVRTKSIDVRGKELGYQVYHLSRPFLDSGYRPEELRILCGPDWLLDLQRSLSGRETSFVAQVQLGGIDRRPQFYGFKIFVIDHLEGAIVIPERALR